MTTQATAAFELNSPDWNPLTRQRLTQLLDKHRNQKQKVVFDFDNTLVSRDIGEATFARLALDKSLNMAMMQAFSPSFSLNHQVVSLATSVDPSAYYEAYIEALTHHTTDVSAAANSYAWMVQSMVGLTPAAVIKTTQAAFQANQARLDRDKKQDTHLTIPPGKSTYRVPFFPDETVELVGQLLLNGYEVYVVSASNVWTVRHMATVELGKLMQQKFGKPLQIPPQNVFGISTLLRDKTTKVLYKDPYLVKESAAYARMEPAELQRYEITAQIVYPISAFEGKNAVIQQQITGFKQAPFLVAGDSAGDFAMLQLATHRLWMARLENSGYQQTLSKMIPAAEQNTWFIQPVLSKQNPGMVRNQAHLKTLFDNNVPATLTENYHLWLKRHFISE